MTDTFNLNTGRTPTQKTWLPDNDKRAKNQQQFPIQVIVGNPPWSAGQKKATDDNPNVEYPELETRISETYAEYYKGSNIRQLYDTYKMAIRWASDRLDEQGVIAFVTSGSWIDGNVDSGVRACLIEEFSSIYVLHLRGDARTSGERRRSEGGNAFGSGSRTPVAITLLVKNPNATHESCKIHYRDIGDYLTREEKLEALREAVSITGVSDWQTIIPNKHYDWIGQRSEAFQHFYPLGTPEAKAGKIDNAIFVLYSLGLATGRDPYIYNFSRSACAENAERMTQDYLAAISELERNPNLTVDDVSRKHSSYIKWNRELVNNLKRKKKAEFGENYIRKAAYRPFITINCYADYTFSQMKYQVDRIFPDSFSENRVICVPSKGSKNPFSPFMTDIMSDLHFNEFSQCFPRYQYPKPPDTQNTTGTFDGIDDPPDRIDNISDTALHAFRDHYGDDTITKDAIFDYVYGILHAPRYREEFANDLSKMIPRIPFAPDFHTFAEAGAVLASLHLNYETCEQYPLELIFAHEGEPQPHHFRLGTRAMRYTDKEMKTTLILNEHVSIVRYPRSCASVRCQRQNPLGMVY